ncbi:MAG: GtrA family protein [Kiritimatiellaeota bacterium]|nr:GtrA family protein [Kiritimatiellota bacterium]
MKHILRQFAQREAHPGIQFIKYALAGGVATVVDMTAFFLFAWKVFPALKATEFLVQHFHLQVIALSDAERALHYVICKIIAFLFSNTTCYIVNALWVFHPGRHSRRMEFALFFVVSFTSFAIGTGLGWVLINGFGMTAATAYLANMGASLAINFLGRKFLVFSR